jgi:hypothetical protein
MKTKEVVKDFELPDKLVTVKFIKRRRGMAANVSDDHIIAGGMLPNAKKKFAAPLKQNGSVANVLTKEEKEYLEDRLQMNLSVYGDFWTTFQVSLFKDDTSNIFNLNDPLDYIAIQLLRKLDDVAPNWKSRDNDQSYQFVIVEEDEIQNERKVKLDIKKEAFKLYGKIEDDKEKLLSVLKLLTNQPISKNSKLNWIQGKVEEYVDTTPQSFVNILTDDSFDTKVLISKGVESEVIKRQGNKYTTIDGLDLCYDGQVPSYSNAITYLEDSKNQDVRTLIEAKINSK